VHRAYRRSGSWSNGTKRMRPAQVPDAWYA
jgi:hypothetical protein